MGAAQTEEQGAIGAGEDVGPPLVDVASHILVLCPHHDVSLAITVHVAHRQRHAEEGARLRAWRLQGEKQGAIGAGEDVGPPLVNVVAHILSVCPHCDVRLAVAVYVAHRCPVAELSVRLGIGAVKRILVQKARGQRRCRRRRWCRCGC